LSINNLATVLWDQGKHDKAEMLHRQALEGREKELGPQHPGTLISMYDLAQVLHKQKRYEDASSLYQQACDGFTQKLGLQHPTTVACLNYFSTIQKELDTMKLQA